jgi:hypothetical protein
VSADFDVTPVPASTVSSWDDEADVVIAGYGIAGAAAAVEAARAGADVLVVERTGSWGGAAAMAGGFIYLGGGTALQKACGFTDSVDNMAAFLSVAMGPGADEKRIAGRPAASVEQHDGRGIQMAQALGADLAHMDATEVAIFIDPQQLVRGILVNARSQRYVAEDTYPGRVGQLTLYHQDNTAYLIIDGDAQDKAMASLSPQFMLRPPTWVADSVVDLERDIGLAPGSLQATVAAYNDGAARGEDPLLHKKPERCKPIGTPVGAIDLRESTGGLPSVGCAPRWMARCCTSTESPSRGCSPRAVPQPDWPPGATQAASRLATAASTAAAPADPQAGAELR